MTAPALAAALSAALLASACRTAPPRPERPAVIVDPTPRSRAALGAAVSAAVGAPVTLADDALTGSSALVIEPAHPRDASGLPLQGRETRMPERFRLVASDGRCILVHERTGKRYPLADTACAPPPP